ncbi:MAG: DegT/DnrJ/EryC1/StrS family aminotransferase [Actinomycetota bacterium]
MTRTDGPAGRPAILGGPPAFPEGLPLVRPTVPHVDELTEDLRRILERRVLTNGPLVGELEERAAERLGVPHCVAVASCTAGLMLVAQAAEPPGEVVLPSFTFAATAHAVVWAGHRPVFADVDGETLTLSPEAAGRAVSPSTRAIVATHVYGTPCDVEALRAVALQAGVRLFFDAAHAFGSRRGDVPVGRFGDAEVFSFTPTKLVVAGEGGLIATPDPELAERFRIGREYANPGDYDSRFPGLNARMSELHAALALRSLATLDERVARRNELAARYRSSLAGVPGVSFPHVEPGDTTTFKDLTILVDPEAFGADAGCLAVALGAEGIDTRRYYFPPVHLQRAYRGAGGGGELAVTEWAAARVLTLPMWEEMTEAQVDRVAEAIGRIGSWPGVAAACAAAG